MIARLERRGRFLDEVRRVLRPGGRVLLSVPNAQTSWKRLRRRLGLPSLADPAHRAEYALADLRDEVARAGFSVREVRPVAPDSPWSPFADLLGALWPAFDGRWSARMRRIALARPGDSKDWRLVLELTP